MNAHDDDSPCEFLDLPDVSEGCCHDDGLVAESLVVLVDVCDRDDTRILHWPPRLQLNAGLKANKPAVHSGQTQQDHRHRHMAVQALRRGHILAAVQIA